MEGSQQGRDEQEPQPPDSSEGGKEGGLSRRQVLFTGGSAVVGAAIGVGVTLAVDNGGTNKTIIEKIVPAATAPTMAGVPLVLTTSQARTLNAMLERMIPKDANGPGAEEAMVWRYIDGALAGDLSELLPMYGEALDEIEAAAARTSKKPFHELEPEEQDSMITGLEEGKGPGGESGAAFFATMREHALEGMFGDPAHGGNANFAGWDLIGFPGIKLAYSEGEQAVGTKVKPAHKSTYEFTSTFGIGQGA